MHGGNTFIVVLSKMYFLYLLIHVATFLSGFVTLGVQNFLFVSLVGV